MQITCSCGKKLQVNDDLAGRRVKCPGCGQAILAREDAVQPTARPAARPTFAEEDEDRPPRPRLRDDAAEPGRAPARGVSVLGVVSLVLGVLGALISLFPCIGWVVGAPLAGIGLVLGLIGLIVAMKGKRSGTGLPIAGTVVSLLGLIIAGVWLGISSLWVQQASQQIEQKEQERQEIRQGQAIEVTATALAKEYNDNSIAADARYKGKVLAVKGRVERVTDDGLHATVELKADEEGETVDCEFPLEHKNDLVGLKPGQQVTIRGKCKGQDGGSPTLEKCILIR